ncbi:hypothetical protein WHR41_06128 [Cladosporium halotolerans]|uniref:DUF2470 domain-containing protein n=1 Tax=Cladosporium halotolerans TaxID=1052096 RepID=A0AB34KJW6_9PEZI
MSEKQAQDAAAQQRIVSHMQADHHDSIVRYLEHYRSLPALAAGAARLHSIDLNGMTIHAFPNAHRIPFDPPLSSYRDARARLVAMDAECRLALRRSDTTISEFLYPSGTYALEVLIVAATFAAYSSRRWFAPAGPVAGLLGEGFAGFSWTIQPWLFWGMVAIHAAELAWFVPARLRRHSVNVRRREFWLWCAAEFLGGVFCSRRFDALVERRRREAEGRKH